MSTLILRDIDGGHDSLGCFGIFALGGSAQGLPYFWPAVESWCRVPEFIAF